MSSSEEYLDSLLASMNGGAAPQNEDSVVLSGSDEEQTFENAYIEDYFEEFQKKGIIGSDSEEAPAVETQEATAPAEEALSDFELDSLLEELNEQVDEEPALDIPVVEPENMPGEAEEIAKSEALEAIYEPEEEVEEEPEEEVIEEEMFMDLSEIDAILKDKSEVHPELFWEPEPVSEEEAIEGVNLDIDNELAGLDEVLSMSQDNVTFDENLGIDAESLMDLEDVDALLAAASDNSDIDMGVSGDFAGDDDLMEIQNLLQKSDSNEMVDDELLSMLDELEQKEHGNPETDIIGTLASEESDTPEEEPKDKKKKKKEKKSKKKAENAEGTEGVEKAPKEKKPGLFAKLKAFAFEDDSEEEAAEEAAKDKPKKEKKAKGKAKKSAAKPGSEEDINAQIEAELEAEDKKKKPKKEKKEKPKKEKKPKVKKEPEPEKFSDRSTIKLGGVIATLLICFSLFVVILIFAYFLPKQGGKIAARAAYYTGDYETAALNLYGEKLNSSDTILYKKASLLYGLQLRYEKFETYKMMGDEMSALDELFQGRKKCDETAVEAGTLGIVTEHGVMRDKFNEALSESYGLSPEAIDEICTLKPLHYTEALEAILRGEGYFVTTIWEELDYQPMIQDSYSPDEPPVLADPLPGEEGLNEPGVEITITGEESPDTLLDQMNQLELVDPLPEEQ